MINDFLVVIQDINCHSIIKKYPCGGNKINSIEAILTRKQKLFPSSKFAEA